MNYFVDLDEQILTIIPIQSSDRQKTEFKIFKTQKTLKLFNFSPIQRPSSIG